MSSEALERTSLENALAKLRSRPLGGVPLLHDTEADALLAALAVAREREQRLREVLAAVLALTDECGVLWGDAEWDIIVAARAALRAALVDEPAAATLAEPEGVCPPETTASTESRAGRFPGSASAAADEPAHKRPASSDGMGRTPPGGRATQDPEIGASLAAAVEPGETP